MLPWQAAGLLFANVHEDGSYIVTEVTMFLLDDLGQVQWTSFFWARCLRS